MTCLNIQPGVAGERGQSGRKTRDQVGSGSEVHRDRLRRHDHRAHRVPEWLRSVAGNTEGPERRQAGRRAVDRPAAACGHEGNHRGGKASAAGNGRAGRSPTWASDAAASIGLPNRGPLGAQRVRAAESRVRPLASGLGSEGLRTQTAHAGAHHPAGAFNETASTSCQRPVARKSIDDTSTGRVGLQPRKTQRVCVGDPTAGDCDSRRDSRERPASPRGTFRTNHALGVRRTGVLDAVGRIGVGSNPAMGTYPIDSRRAAGMPAQGTPESRPTRELTDGSMPTFFRRCA